MERMFFFEIWSNFLDFPFSWKQLVLDTGLEKVVIGAQRVVAQCFLGCRDGYYHSRLLW